MKGFRTVAIICCCALLLPPRTGRAQAKHLTYDLAGAFATGSAAELPFWLTANRRGRVGRYSSGALTTLGAAVPPSPGRQLDYSFGLELLARTSRQSTLTAQQLYGRLRYEPLQLTVGRVSHVAGITDTSLSVGSMMWSENAPPVPRISLSTPAFTAIPGTDGWLHAKGYLAHGSMEPGRYVTEAHLHEKYLYVRFAPDAFPVHGYAGIVHNAIWGGIHPVEGPQRESFGDFLRTFLGYRPDSDNTAEALGNTVAMYDFALEWDWIVDGLIYREFYIEDKPGLSFRSPFDGLWGVSLDVGRGSLPLVESLLWEHVSTQRQGSRYDLGEKQGADNYYNHSLYRSGWTYQGRTIGTPLLFTDEQHLGVVNNRLIAHHVGIEGNLLSAVNYRLLLTYSRNYGARFVVNASGTPRIESGRTKRRDQYSTLLAVEGPIAGDRGLRFNAALAVDYGSVHPDNVGLLVGLSYSGHVGGNGPMP